MARTIISWDVGICNLAYCVLRERKKKDHPKILAWDSINLLLQEDHSCCGKLKKGSACQQKAKYVLTTPHQTYYLCTRHSKTHQLWDEEQLADCYQPVLGPKCDHLARTGTKCKTIARVCYLDQTNLCTSHQRSHRKQSAKTFCCQRIPKETTSNTSTAEIQLRLYRMLDRVIMPLLREHDVSEMIIENQPAMKNSGMKAIATALFAWGVIRGQVDCIETPGCRSPGQPVLIVRFVSASNKMKLAYQDQEGTGEDEIEQARQADGEFTESQRYNLTKKLGIQHTRQILADQPKWLAVLDQFQNPADPCDAFLLGKHALQKE